MASVKVLLRKRENKDGSRPLILQIIKDRKASVTSLGYNVYTKDWDETTQRVKKSHPNSTRLNNLIATRVAEAHNSAIEIETQKKVVSAKAIMKKVKLPEHGTFFTKAEEYLAHEKAAGNHSVYTSNKPRIKHFKEFLDDHDIAFSDITVSLLERFKVYLKHTRDINERTIMNHLSAIRSVYKFAFEDKEERRKYSPFGDGKISISFPPSTKVGLSAEDLKKLENVELSNPKYDHARNLWLISFYFAGMRISDVLRLKWSDFQDSRLHYAMGKNQKVGSLKIPDQAKSILDKYLPLKSKDDDFVFDDLRGYNPKDTFTFKRRIADVTSRYDKFLRLHVVPEAKISGKLSMHIARHTFATLAGDKIPIQMLQKLYRHSDIKTTIGYQANFINKDADDALDAVLNR